MKIGEKVSGYTVLANTDRSGLQGCSGKSCPTVYQFDEDSVLVQGYIAGDLFSAGDVPTGEDVVRVPKGLLRQLAAEGNL